MSQEGQTPQQLTVYLEFIHDPQNRAEDQKEDKHHCRINPTGEESIEHVNGNVG